MFQFNRTWGTKCPVFFKTIIVDTLKPKAPNYNWTDKSILIIDDDHLNCKVIAHFLDPTLCNYSCQVNPQKAISLIKENNFDLIFTEVLFRKYMNYDILEQIRSINKTIPIIVQTAYFFYYQRYMFFERGANAFFTKPLPFRQLPGILNSYLYLD